MGTPVVDIYAMTAPDHTPWAVPHRVVSRNVHCKYCYQSVCPEGHGKCLREITPDEVLAAVMDLAGEVFPAVRADDHAAAGLKGIHRRAGRRVRERR